MTTIGVIGAGHIGRNFSIAAIERGYDVVISNATGPEALTDLISELGPKARAATAADAAAAGDFALLAIPLPGAGHLPVEPLAGKVVLTTVNYFPQRDRHFPDIDAGKVTVPGYLQARLPESKVIRVFNHIDAANIVSDGTPAGTPNRRALGYAGDDPEAKTLAANLYESVRIRRGRRRRARGRVAARRRSAHVRRQAERAGADREPGQGAAARDDRIVTITT